MVTLFFCGWQVTAAESISGKWSGNPFYMFLQQEGGTLTGTCGPGQKQQTAIENAQIQGDRLTFQVRSFVFDLHVRGDEIEGTARRGDDAPINILVRRVTASSGGAGLLDFDAASVKRSQPASGPRPSDVKFTTGRFTCSNLSLQSLIVRAFGVKDYQISGPDWIATEVYDITATTTPVASADDVFVMLQHLLAERFKLRIHREIQELEVYGLSGGKNGPKLKRVEGFPTGKGLNSPGRLMLPGTTLGDLAAVLSRRLDRPVLDMTGMQGLFEVNLEWTPDGYRIQLPADDDPRGNSFFDALKNQAGLKLEARKAPIEMIVVDHAERIPVPN